MYCEISNRASLAHFGEPGRIGSTGGGAKFCVNVLETTSGGGTELVVDSTCNGCCTNADLGSIPGTGITLFPDGGGWLLDGTNAITDFFTRMLCANAGIKMDINTPTDISTIAAIEPGSEKMDEGGMVGPVLMVVWIAVFPHLAMK